MGTKFKDILEAVRKNSSNGYISTYGVDDAEKYSSESGSYVRDVERFTIEQVKQLAIALMENTNVTEVHTGYYHHFSAPDELKPYLELIESVTKRNSSQQAKVNTKLSNYIKADLSNFIMKPLVIAAELGKELLSRTLGLSFVYNFLRRKGPGHVTFTLPTLSFQMQQGSYVYRHLTGDQSSYPVIGIGKNAYSGSYLSVPFAIINYVFRNIGKLIGIALVLPFSPILAIAALGKAIITVVKDKYALDKEFKDAAAEAENNLAEMDIHHGYYEGNLFRDRGYSVKAYELYINTPQTDEHYMAAMFEAGNISLHILENREQAKSAYEKGLAIAVEKNDEAMIADFQLLIRACSSEKDAVISFAPSVEQVNPTNNEESKIGGWRGTSSSTEQYDELRAKVNNTSAVTVIVEESQQSANNTPSP